MIVAETSPLQSRQQISIQPPNTQSIGNYVITTTMDVQVVLCTIQAPLVSSI